MHTYIKNISTIFILFLLLHANNVIATLYCNGSYTELKIDPGRPYNAVGYLNNGCTAFLVDSSHIVAAAHCFTDIKTGEWQNNLRFYPNFHPDRIAANSATVPNADVSRVVVGSRVETDDIKGAGPDWGIAKLTNWRNIGGIDLTPITIATGVPPNGTAIINPAYTRHHFPYNDHDVNTWDNMMWDNKYCDWVGNNEGMWAISTKAINCDARPLYNGTTKDRIGCNSRWGPGMIHKQCQISNSNSHIVTHNCDTVGGSSGSPLIYKKSNGRWYVVAVTHGGGSTDFSQISGPACTPNGSFDNVSASVTRFRFAPRFASNVAVHRSPKNKSGTALFAVDSDLNQLVFRYRKGNNPNYNSEFTFWKLMGTPYAGAQLSNVAACSADTEARPQVFIVANNGNIYSRRYGSDNRWHGWENLGKPGTVNIADIDTTTNLQGRCQLFAVANNGNAYTRRKLSTTSWSNWETVATGSFRKVSGLKYMNQLNVTLLDSAGQIWRTSLKTNWRPLEALPALPGLNNWIDLDMTWDEHARGFMLALAQGGGDKLWFMPMYGSDGWRKWHAFGTKLWAKEPSASPTMLSVTASRWMEDPQGSTSPVVFATGDKGNIYFIEYARTGRYNGWVLQWKSFYHEFIPYK